MKNINVILSDVLEEIQPDKNYEKEIFARLNSIIKKINQNQKNIKAVLGGSGAKGTWLKTFDADIFVLFDYSKFRDKSDKLSDILEKILRKKSKKFIRIHGSRDYFQIRQNGFTFEIIPILKIKKAEQAKNITDVSPLHSNWVKKHKKLINEMKLTKQFCQAQNVYGAESYIRGFSGYVCEILTVYYGSFLNLIKNAAKWQDKVVVDIEKYYRGKDVFKIVNTSKLISPLIVIDPVQKDRNAAAALSNEKFEMFKKAAKDFLNNPSKTFFINKDIKELFFKLKSKNNREIFYGLRSKNTKLVILKIKPVAGKIDVVGTKLLKIYEFLNRQLQKHGFKIIKSGWEWNKKDDGLFYYLFDKKQLPRTIELEGPPLAIKHHVEQFKKIHKHTFNKSKRIFALEKRKYTSPEDLLKNLSMHEFVRERGKSMKINVL